MIEKKWLVPDVIDPAQKVCIQLEIPNDLKHIAAFWGALQELTKAWNWEDSYNDGSATAYVWQPIIETAAQQVRIGENCMLDCQDVEDCLGTSTIINVIEGDIITNEGDIENNTTNITNNEADITIILEGGDDTNVYPPAPTPAEPDELCGAAYHIAQEVIDLVEQTVIDVGVLALAAWLLSWLGIGGWLGTQLSLFWDYILANEIALTGVDFDIYLDQLAQALYCAELDRAQAIIDLDPAIPTLRRDALIKGMESPTDAQILLWAFVGSFDDTNDCTDFCAWCILHDWTTGAEGWAKAAHVNGAGILGGSGWVHEDIINGFTGIERRRTVMIEQSFTASKVTGLDVLCDFTIANFEDNVAAIIFITELSTVRTDVYTKVRDDAPQGTDINVAWVDAAGQDMDHIRLFFRSSRDTTSPYAFGGNILLKEIEICGDAPRPPEL